MTRRLPSALDLTRPQFDGRACVWCRIPLWKNAVSAGRAEGRLGEHDLSIEVYACPACADAPTPKTPAPEPGRVSKSTPTHGREDLPMTVAPERTVVATRRGRDLVSDSDFEMLAAFCATEYSLDRALADRVMDQALAMIYVMGTTRSGDAMAPSEAVDPGWHTAILHTEWYADFCTRQFGYLLHHKPNSKTRSRGLMADVTGRIEAEGFHVDRILWGTAAECNPPTCCGDGPCC